MTCVGFVTLKRKQRYNFLSDYQAAGQLPSSSRICKQFTAMSYQHKLPPSAEWKDASHGQGDANGFIGGRDHSDNIYVGRAIHNEDLLPGKIVPSHGCCYVCYDGKEHRKTSYQVMCDTYSSVGGWVADCDGNVPSRAIQGGITSSGEALYIGRVTHEGTTTVGKIHPSHRCCYIPYGGREHKYSSYEVLVSKAHAL